MRDENENPINVRLLEYENSGTPKKVAADCDVARMDIATAKRGMVLELTKYSLDDSILDLLNRYELTIRMAKYEKKTIQSR